MNTFLHLLLLLLSVSGRVKLVVGLVERVGLFGVIVSLLRVERIIELVDFIFIAQIVNTSIYCI